MRMFVVSEFILIFQLQILPYQIYDNWDFASDLLMPTHLRENKQDKKFGYFGTRQKVP